MKSIFEIIGIDDYEFTARYIPAFIFETAFLLSFWDNLNLSLETLTELNKIFPLSIFLPAMLIVASFPVKTVLRLIGEFVENILWKIKNPTIFYLEHHKKEACLIKIDVDNCENKGIYLSELLEYKECYRFIIEKIKKETRSDKKLREKLKEYGFFKNTFTAFLIMFLIDCLLISKYATVYLIFSLIFFILMVISSYYTYPKQLLNSYIEKNLK